MTVTIDLSRAPRPRDRSRPERRVAASRDMLAAAGAEVLVNDLLEERTDTVVGEIEAARRPGGGRRRST